MSRLTNFLFLARFVFSDGIGIVILNLYGRRQNERREEAWRNWFLRGGRRNGYIISTDLNIVDEDVGVIDCGGQVVRGSHFAIHNEFEMMSSRRKLKNGGKAIPTFTVEDRGSERKLEDRAYSQQGKRTHEPC